MRSLYLTGCHTFLVANGRSAVGIPAFFFSTTTSASSMRSSSLTMSPELFIALCTGHEGCGRRRC